ncbi:MAG: AAA family ATPase, partial [Synechococcaceae cyanobacterium RL_1_2]|nr:AAA family ATPase [Synechococcaceae cyanobacterium RL_1_2]
MRLADQAPVILKLLKADYPTPEDLANYRQEYERVKALESKLTDISQVYALERYERTALLVFADTGAISFQQYLQNFPHQRLPLALFLDYAVKITAIVEQIHDQAVIHRDLNPSNIVVELDTQSVKIIDFGLAWQLAPQQRGLENLNTLEGTLAYVSPEQTGRSRQMIDFRSDLYSLGITFYQMVTGQLPFTGASGLEVIHGHLAKMATLPHLLNNEIPVIVSKIIMTLMAKVPEERYQTASGLLADLALCQQSHEKFGDIPEFELTGADYYQRFYIPYKIYGRGHELDRLQHHLRNLTTEPGQAQLVLIAGYAGIGKSSLVNELLHHFHGWDGYYLEAKFDQFQSHIPYSPILSALRSLIRSLLSPSGDQLQQIRNYLSSQPQERWLLLKETIPEISLLSAATTTDGTQPIREDHHQFLVALQQLIIAFTRVGEPLILFLDDLQWADGASLTLIQTLA